MTKTENVDPNTVPEGKGVRKLTLEDQMPKCKYFTGKKIYDLREIAKNKHVVDIGCGFGRNRELVESVGGTWIGVEPFEGGAHTVVGDAENLPFKDQEFDVVIMDAVLEHIPKVARAFEEVARILKSGGLFVGYVAFMECFHEISYSHLSHKALEHYSEINGMRLEKVSASGAFGIDYHFYVILHPLPVRWCRKIVACMIKVLLLAKSTLAYFYLRLIRKMKHAPARSKSIDYYTLLYFRFSAGFNYVIKKL